MNVSTDLFGNPIEEPVTQGELGATVDPLDDLRERARRATLDAERNPDSTRARLRAREAVRDFLRYRDHGRGKSLEEVAAELALGDPEELDPLVFDMFDDLTTEE